MRIKQEKFKRRKVQLFRKETPLKRSMLYVTRLKLQDAIQKFVIILL